MYEEDNQLKWYYKIGIIFIIPIILILALMWIGYIKAKELYKKYKLK